MKKYVKLYEEFINPTSTHPGLITDPAQVTQWIEENLVGKKDRHSDFRIKEETYIVNPNGVVDVDESVNLYDMGLEYIPIQFGKITEDFSCSVNQLTSLLGSPNHVGGTFLCGENQLTSLLGAPSYVGGRFYCRNNHLTSLTYVPNYVGGFFVCWNNFLCINEPYEIDRDNPGYDTKDLELIAYRFQEKVKDHPNKVEICKSVLDRPDLVEMFIKYNVTEVTQYLSDDVKDIVSTAMKGNHKLR